MTTLKNSQTPRPSSDPTILETMFNWLRLRTRIIASNEPLGLKDEGQVWSWEDNMNCETIKLTALGYRVEWRRAAVPWVWVVSEQRNIPYRPLIWAEAKVFLKPSSYGIDGGRISKLKILMLYRPGPDCCGAEDVLYRYDRELELNRLTENRRAMRLYFDLLRELN